MSDSEDIIDLPEEGGDDLFGDEGDEVMSDQGNVLSDRDLESDREDDRDRIEDEDDYPREDRDSQHLAESIPLYRHRIPKSKDNTLHNLKVPNFLKFNPVEYKPDEWQPSKWELNNANSENPIPSIMWRRDPKTGKLKSNANIHRWSDGSTTLQIGDDHYEITSNSLVGPPNEPYQDVKDAHEYAAAAHLTTNSLLIVGHYTEQYSIKPPEELQDAAFDRLVAGLNMNKKESTTSRLIATNEDPERKKREAELAEKERAKNQRRRETAAARSEGAGSRYKGGALSIGDLEGRRGAGGSRKRGAPGGAKKKHRRPEYDSDDDLPSGARRTDNYDMDDGFLVGSDEDDDVVEDDEEEDILDDEDEDERPRVKRQRTADPEEDADGDDDDDAPAASHRRRRRVVNDDDDE
ncbi:Putative protein of unknown function [Podospora comata]|uniref:RNA polymerase-associated protein LEO1 n=1 Tax=Podospora comata TaxID=48703 RepID=A0ABY6RWI2_PODCO|nr:Putative protein of unknown function [Podospora comata]